MMELSGPTQPPAAGGKPRQLVVLLHGYGSNGEDLIGLAPFFAQALPEAEFLSPNAPFPCELSPFGFQWFGLEDRSPDMKLGGVSFEYSPPQSLQLANSALTLSPHQ